VEGVKKIKVGALEVGLVGLDEIFKEVRALRIEGDDLKEELIKRAKLYNWIREDREGEYKSALFSAYKEFCQKIDSER
jgi:hypothetical protein